jgi:hypothetical protein
VPSSQLCEGGASTVCAADVRWVCLDEAVFFLHGAGWLGILFRSLRVRGAKAVGVFVVHLNSAKKR